MARIVPRNISDVRTVAVVLATLFLSSPATADTALADRVEAVSRRLLGASYRLGPLGEEVAPDVDPRFRLDAFDCTTYVETVLALSLAGVDTASGDLWSAEDEAAARVWLDRIRYTGDAPSFDTRRHLIDAQWIPELIAAGLVRDVTREVGGRSARTASITLRRESWERSAMAKDLGLAWSAVPAGRHQLPYLPWRALERDDVRAALPSSAILSTVASPDPDTPTLVTHQVLLFRTSDGGLIVRHASSRRHRVADESLDDFVERSRGRRSRSVLGLNVLALVDSDRP